LLRFLSKYTNQLAVAGHVYDEHKLKIKRMKNLQLIENSVPFLFRTKNAKKNTIGFIGRFTNEKRFHSFLTISSQIASSQPDISFHAMGGLLNNPQDNVKIISSTFSVDQFYENIDLLLFTSVAPEGLPLVILEAIAFDVGVIAYPLKGAVEILGEDYPLLVKNENEIISKISKFYSLEYDLVSMSKIHKERSEKFNFANMINSIDNIYQSLIV